MRTRALPVLVLVLGLLAAACSAQALEFTIGECINLPDGEEISDYEVVDCAEAHDAEVYALPQSPEGPDAPFPGQDALLQFANERCEQAFEPYVGTPYDDSAIYYSPLVPTADAWESAEDREIVCLLVGEPTGDGFQQLTGSKEGSGE